MTKDFDLATYLFIIEKEMEESRIVLDEQLGWVFYPCSNALDEALEKSMA